MALQGAVKGATHTGQEITWIERGANTAHDLTGATLTGRIEDANGTGRDITGTLALVDASSGVFTWAYSAADVVEIGTFKVQFKAAFPGTKYDLTFFEEWTVARAL